MAIKPEHMSRPQAVKHIREQLGCGLREAADFYLREPSTFMTRLESQIEHQKTVGSYYESPEDKIRTVLREHEEAVKVTSNLTDTHALALDRIRSILGVHLTGGQSAGNTSAVTRAKL